MFSSEVAAKFSVLGVPIAATDLAKAVAISLTWAREGTPRYITVTGVHGVIESQDHPDVMAAHRAAGMCIPDGRPMVWAGRLARHAEIEQVRGCDFLPAVMEATAANGMRHFLYGGQEGVADELAARLVARFPGLQIVGTYCPPFRPLTPNEEDELAARLNVLRPDFLWVGLSTPKQERWMAAHCGKLAATVMIGVGAAFDFHTDRVAVAPRWLMPLGLEWLHRLWMEPRRLWRRYLFNNPRFIMLYMKQLLGRGPGSGKTPWQNP